MVHGLIYDFYDIFMGMFKRDEELPGQLHCWFTDNRRTKSGAKVVNIRCLYTQQNFRIR